jgi:hypothetical protein
LPRGEPGSGAGQRPPELIDRSFYGLYTDPSKPPAIGDLAVLEQGLSPVGGTSMALNAASLLSSFADIKNGFSGASRDGMGTFQLAGMSSLLSNPKPGSTRERLWPQFEWWPDAPMCQQSSLRFHPSSSINPHTLYQFCAVDARSAGRAPESTRRSLLRMWSGTARAFRRWMLPTVERGPPGHGSVWTSVCSLARAGFEA